MLKNIVRLPFTFACIAVRALSETEVIRKESERLARAHKKPVKPESSPDQVPNFPLLYEERY